MPVSPPKTQTTPVQDASADDFGIVKSLTKGLAALDRVLDAGPVRTTDLAEHLGIDKGGASRLLRTLVQCGYAVRTTDRRYAAGPRLTAGARGAALRPFGAPFGLKRRARPLLQRLVDETGETAHLAIMADDQALYLDTADSTMALRVDRPAGTLAPLYCTALGKIFLAFCGAPIPAHMRAYTPHTTTDPEAFRQKVARITERGFAIDDEELYLGVRCVAAPLRAADGTVLASLGLSGPATRIPAERLESLGLLVCEVARSFVME
jgi:DNA-binding IclR family transcriptional regulator